MSQRDIASHPAGGAGADSDRPLLTRLNTVWHERALRTFTVIVLAHWAEHLAQAYQVYVLGWKVPDARGVLGIWFPWLIKSELLHYGYAVVMLVGLWMFRSGFQTRSLTWWTISLGIQFWHHIEHGLLQAQAILGRNFFNAPVPTSIAQLWIPRVELHLFYNTIVFIPMAIAMYYHMFPSAGEAAHQSCTCAFRPRAVTA
jgi:hypothetical protein